MVLIGIDPYPYMAVSENRQNTSSDMAISQWNSWCIEDAWCFMWFTRLQTWFLSPVGPTIPGVKTPCPYLIPEICTSAYMYIIVMCICAYIYVYRFIYEYKYNCLCAYVYMHTCMCICIPVTVDSL
jgi:hypothetical protein